MMKKEFLSQNKSMKESNMIKESISKPGQIITKDSINLSKDIDLGKSGKRQQSQKSIMVPPPPPRKENNPIKPKENEKLINQNDLIKRNNENKDIDKNSIEVLDAEARKKSKGSYAYMKKEMSIFECSHCGKKFGKQMSLKGHVQTCHPSEISKNQELLHIQKPNSERGK